MRDSQKKMVQFLRKECDTLVFNEVVSKSVNKQIMRFAERNGLLINKEDQEPPKWRHLKAKFYKKINELKLKQVNLLIQNKTIFAS